MVSSNKLLSDPYWKLIFIFSTNDSDKQLVAVISHNNKLIAFFSIRTIKQQRNYTTTEKEFTLIVECLIKFRGILFDYEKNVFSDHKIPVHAATLRESQRVMR